MRPRRVALLSNRSLLASGVQRLLESRDGFQLSTVGTDDGAIYVKLAQAAPHVIVLDSGDRSLGEGLITRLLEEHPRAKVIALNLAHTGMDVYRIKRVVPTDLEGLLNAIEGRPLSIEGKPARKGNRE